MVWRTVYSFLFIALAWAYRPDEGMWLLLQILEQYEELKAKGLQLSPEQIYSETQPSLKDAIVQLGNFCSGSFISPEGLVITNHHCAYSSIQEHSSIEHDYLTHGFWAKSRDEELHTPGLYVRILVRMERVTDKVLDENGTKDASKVEALIKAAEKEGPGYEAEVKEMFSGNEYYLFVYQRFDDVRLVGAPPSSIGKFGGDTDNWMWPRHTGDFALFRVYANKNNEPAPYSPDNVPYKPKYFLPISLKGVKKGDFTMIMGFPGSTERYLTSYELETKLKHLNPILIENFRLKLQIMKKAMDEDDAVRIQLADEYASLSNSYKYYFGQTQELKRYHLIDTLRLREQQIQQWIEQDEKRKEKYGDLLQKFEQLYKTYADMLAFAYYINTTLFAPSATEVFFELYRLRNLNLPKKKKEIQIENTTSKDKASKETEATYNKEEWGEVSEEETESENETEGKDDFNPYSILQKSLEKAPELFDDYVPIVDQKIFEAMLLKFYQYVDPKPQWLKQILKKAKGKTPEEKIQNFAEKAYQKSVLTDQKRYEDFLRSFNSKQLQKDPLFAFYTSLLEYYNQKIIGSYFVYFSTAKQLQKQYMQLLMEYQPNKKFYPDANFTLRLTYGKVLDYYPKDAVYYHWRTTHYGILEKYVPGDEEFDVPERLLTLLQNKDFGIYAEGDTLPVCFITDNDITGGNSGSPIMNARGELIGLAFDGNWESMSSDIMFNPRLQRTINVDIRYCLFIIDKFAGASHLLKEMDIRR